MDQERVCLNSTIKMDSSCLVIVSILEGRNFELPEECELTGGEYHLMIEVKFNEETLSSDPIILSNHSVSCRPEIYTELAWQLPKRSLHQYRVERRPIKLQCYLVRTETNEKSLIGYLVIDLRTAQETEEPKHEWKPLLNTKHRGSHKTRPEIQIALHVAKPSDDNEHINGSTNDPVAEKNVVAYDGREKLQKNVAKIDDLEYDIVVKEIDGWFRIWDSRKPTLGNSLYYNLSVVIVSADQLSSLFSMVDQSSTYCFKFTLLGKTIRTKSFNVASSEGPVDLPVEKITFKVAPWDLDILKKYFELNPILEIHFCSSEDTSNIASATIPLTNLYTHANGPSPVVGEFALIKNSLALNQSDTSAVIGVYVALEKIQDRDSRDLARESIITISDSSLSSSPLTSPERTSVSQRKLTNQESLGNNIPKGIISNEKSNRLSTNKKLTTNGNASTNDNLHHYCLSIDIRNIRSISPSFNWSKSSFLVQYSYAFFGPTTKIKTSQVSVTSDETINFENGFFTFNFVTSEAQLRDTFENIALILELIEVSTFSNKAIIRGISHINLLDLWESEESDRRKLLVTKPIITDYSDEKVAQLTVIFSLQNVRIYQNGHERIAGSGRQMDYDLYSGSDSNSPGINANSTSIIETMEGKTNLNQIMNNSIFNQIDHLFIEAALEIEAWKQSQIKLFRERIEKKEKKITERKIHELALLELQLKESLEKVSLQEKLLNERRKQLDSENNSRASQEIGKLREEMEQLKLAMEEKCGKIDKLEIQNQQLKNKLLTNGQHSDLARRNSSLSTKTGSISRATGKAITSSDDVCEKGTSVKNKQELKNFVLRSSASDFKRNNSLPSSTRSKL